MHKKNKMVAIVAIAVALAFIMPVSAVANIDAIGVTSDSEITGDMENIVEISTNSDISDTIETASDDELIEDPFIEPTIEDPVIDAEELSVVIDDTIPVDTIPVLSTGITVYVDDDFNSSTPGWGVTHFDKVKDGVVAASAGDTLYIHNGTYNEYGILVNKQLNIMGESRENVIINGGTSYSDVMKITADYVNISTLTMKRSASGGNNLYVYRVANFIMKDCNVDNTVKKGDGIEVYQSTGAIDIINCDVYNAQYGIYANAPVNPTNIIDCNAYNNQYTGIQIRYCRYPVADLYITNCNSYNNGRGMYLDTVNAGNKEHAYIINCSVYNNIGSSAYGISLANADNVDIINCTTYNNTKEGIKMGSGYNDPEDCTITGCTSYGNAEGIVLDAIRCIVTGNTMYDNGANLVIEGDPYQYTIDPTNTVSGKPVYWLIGVENLTLDGSLNFGFLGLLGCNNITARDASPEGVVLSYTTNTTLSNLTVSGAYQGFYLYGGSNIKIDNCTLSGNSVYGFYIYYTDNVEITDCTVTNMLSQGAEAFWIKGSPGVKITNCIAHDVGKSYGFYIYSCPNAILTNCQAYNGGPTYATGIALYDSPYVNLMNCTVHHFQAGFYIRYDSPFANFTDCTAHDITNNGFYIWASDCNYVNCTVYDTGWNGGFFLNQMMRNNFTNCKSYNNSCGAYFYGAQENNFVNCDFYNNSRHGLDIHKGPTNPSYGNTFTNCNIYNHISLNPVGHGVLIEENSYGTILTNCNVYNNNYGVYIYNSPDNILKDVAIDSNTHSFNVIGSAIADFYQDIDTSNTINGDPIYYLVDEENMTIGTTDAGIGYLALISCNNITVQNFDISGAGLMLIQTTNSTLFNVDVHDGTGILLWESSDNDITGCTVYNNTGHGIYLRDDSSDNDIASCTVYNNTGHGIYLLNSPNNIITTGCTVYDNNYGIYLSTSLDITITSCTVDNNNYGIYLSASPDTTITSCTVDNNNYGIHISASANNILRNNILTNNIIGFGMAGAATADFFQDIDKTNKIDGVPIWYVVGESDMIIDGTVDVFSYFILVDCDNMTVQNIDGGDLLIILTTNSTFDNIAAHHDTYGIYLWGSSNNKVKDCTAYNNTETGIYLRDSHYNDLTGFTAYDNDEIYNKGYGIYLSESSNNVITGCDSYSHGSGGKGVFLSGASYNDFINCDVYDNSNGFNLLAGTAGTTNNNFMLCDIYGNANYNFYARYANDNSITYSNLYDSKRSLHLENVLGFVVDNCNIYGNSGEGIYAKYFDFSTISNCNIYGGGSYGIYMTYSDDNNIENCDISDKSNGIYVHYSNRNNIENCDISHGTKGMYFYYSDYNDVEQCDIYGNSYGMDLYYGCNYNTFWNNTIYANSAYGIYLRKTSGTSYNKAYHNEFGNNGHHTYSYYATNKWDNGYSDPYNATTDGGNYWDDYIGVDLKHGVNQDINGSDGIGDTQYTVYGGSTKDRYPLMNKTIDIIPPEITVVTMTTSNPIDTDPVYGWEKVSCKVTDFALADVKLVLTYPNATTEVFPMVQSGNAYSYETSLTIVGYYTYRIWANDTIDNIAESTNETFALPPNYDVNMDGTVDFWDLVEVVKFYGDTGTPGWIREDVDNNGVVDFWDLVEVVKYYGETW